MPKHLKMTTAPAKPPPEPVVDPPCAMEKDSAWAELPPAPEVALSPGGDDAAVDSTWPDIPAVAAASALSEIQAIPGAAAAEASTCQNWNSDNSCSSSSQSSKELEYPRKTSFDNDSLISSPCPGSPSGKACENQFTQKDQSMKVLVAMCIGLVDDQNQPLIDLA